MATNKSITVALLILLLRSPFLSDKISFNYIFQFGDSINDTGNFHWDNRTSICKGSPYGLSLSGILPRCSDGLLMIDYFVKFFNLTINPYLEKGANFNQGVNFAIASSTALDVSILREKYILSPRTNSSLSVQLKWFKSHLNSICNGALECKKKLGKALIIMGEIGGNDYNLAIKMEKPTKELFELVPEVIQAIKNAVKVIINLGVKTMVLPGNFPIGCLPIFLTKFKTNDPTEYDDLNCLKGLNDFSMFHNNRLQAAIKELQIEYPHATIFYADYFSALRWVIRNAPSLGFDKDKIQKVCCGYGANDYNYDTARFCGMEGVPVCADPNKQISWDGIHFTQHAYQHMSHWLLYHMVPSIITSNNIQVA